MANTSPATASPPVPLCWICRIRPADSGEHRFKASDVRAVAPSVSQGKPVFLQRGRATNDRVGSAKAERLKYPKSICRECNNTLTQPYDLAWERLSDYLLANWPAIVKRGSFDLSRCFAGNTRVAALHVHLFFVKLFGCKIHDGDVPINLAPFSHALLTGIAHPELSLTIGDTAIGAGHVLLYDTPVHARSTPAGELHSALWAYQVRRIIVKVGYIKTGAPFKVVGHPWHPSRPGKIVKLSPDLSPTAPNAGQGTQSP